MKPIKERLKQVLKDGLLDNIACHGKFKLDEEHLNNLTEEVLEMSGKYFLTSVFDPSIVDVQDLTETILNKESEL